jgi:hypothetical protein
MDLYDTVEKLDIAVHKLNYILKAHRAYTGELLEDYWTDKGIARKELDGIDATNNDLIKEFEVIAQKFTDIMRSDRG